MKKLLILLTAMAALLFSCNKDDSNNPSTSDLAKQFFPMKTGSYWIYELYKKPDGESETKTEFVDSIVVSGDTNINGHNYKILRTYSDLYGNYRNYYRDSSGVILSEKNKIILNAKSINDTMERTKYKNGNVVLYKTADYLKEHAQLKSINGGFDSLMIVEHYTFSGALTQDDKHHFPVKTESQYLKHVGLLQHQLFWLNSPTEKTIRKLVRYEISD
ncbi:MAG: hypothetical protein KDC92_00325 [Bacteroidetes bacterium]|nr:hypothetical protein [Bacteroidota bacterium]